VPAKIVNKFQDNKTIDFLKLCASER